MNNYTKDTSFTKLELEAALTKEKKAGNYKGKVVGLKKEELLNILRQLNVKDTKGNVIKYQFSNIPTYKRLTQKTQKPQRKIKKSYGPMTEVENFKNVMKQYSKYTVKSLKDAAMFSKKSTGDNTNITKLKKSGLIRYLKSVNYPFSQIEKKQSKSKPVQAQAPPPVQAPAPVAAKKRGRPRKSQVPAPAQVVAGKRRGRPKGSKNKPKA